MPKGESEQGRIGIGEFEFPRSSIGSVRASFLAAIRAEVPQAVEALRETNAASLSDWARKWNLTDEWVFDVAEQTLREWRANPGLRKHLEWAQVDTVGELVPEPPKIGWAPTIESEVELRARVENHIQLVREWA